MGTRAFPLKNRCHVGSMGNYDRIKGRHNRAFAMHYWNNLGEVETFTSASFATLDFVGHQPPGGVNTTRASTATGRLPERMTGLMSTSLTASFSRPISPHFHKDPRQLIQVGRGKTTNLVQYPVSLDLLHHLQGVPLFDRSHSK